MEDNLKLVLIERMKSMRKKKGLNQDQVAKEAYISRRAYNAIETGSSTPTLETIIRIAEILDCSVDYLAGSSEYNSIGDITGLRDESIESLRKMRSTHQDYTELLNRTLSSGTLSRILTVLYNYSLMCDSSSLTLNNSVYGTDPVVFKAEEARSQLRASAMFDLGKLLDEVAKLYESDRQEAAESRIQALELKLIELEKKNTENQKEI